MSECGHEIAADGSHHEVPDDSAPHELTDTCPCGPAFYVLDGIPLFEHVDQDT